MKHARKSMKVLNPKVLALIVSAVLILTTVVGGTLAWLVDATDEVKNVFTYGDINIELEETTGDTYKMIPGSKITKDPTVTVAKDSEKCWLFVEIKESETAKFSDFMTYEIADGWTKLDVQGKLVYYRVVDATTADADFAVLKNNEVSVKDTVTKGQLNALTEQTYPTLSFTAYAVQFENIATALDAWNIANA